MSDYSKGGLIRSPKMTYTVRATFNNGKPSPANGDVKITAGQSVQVYNGVSWQPVGYGTIEYDDDETDFPDATLCDLQNMGCHWPKSVWYTKETFVFEPHYVSCGGKPYSAGVQVHYGKDVSPQHNSGNIKDYLVCKQHWQWALDYLEDEARECERTQQYLARVGRL